MKKILFLVLAIFVITYAKDPTRAITTDENNIQAANYKSLNITRQPSSPIPAYNPLPQLYGRVEIIGGTSYDWVNGPVTTWCVNDPNYGIHATWMWSNTPDFTDRVMYYNFYDWSSREWVFNAPNPANYMSSGAPVFTHSLLSVAGGADVDPITGNFVICGQYGSPLRPKLARDLAPGTGMFEYTEGPVGWRWPFIAVSNNQAIHVACIDAATTQILYYTRCQPWGTWTTPINVCPPLVDPLGPTQNIQASHTSNKVIITWTNWRLTPRIDSGYYRFSSNGGVTWDAPVALPFPPSSFDSCCFNITGMFAHFDQNDNFHLVCATAPAGFAWPSEVWHYCPTNSPVWSKIWTRDFDTLAGSVGYNALSACRASIVRNPADNYLYVTWEMFDSLNVEPATGRTRADIWVAESRNNGLTWPNVKRITNPGTPGNWNTTSKRFPVAGGVQVTPGATPDTLIVMYMIDSIAGALVQGEHRFCVNAIAIHRVPIPLPSAIEEPNIPQKYYSFALKPAMPNPTSSHTAIYYSLPSVSNIDLTIYDILGRPIRTLFSGSKDAGEYSAIWDGRTDTGKKAEAGVYFITLKTSDKSISQKLIRTN